MSHNEQMDPGEAFRTLLGDFRTLLSDLGADRNVVNARVKEYERLGMELSSAAWIERGKALLLTDVIKRLESFAAPVEPQGAVDGFQEFLDAIAEGERLVRIEGNPSARRIHYGRITVRIYVSDTIEKDPRVDQLADALEQVLEESGEPADGTLLTFPDRIAAVVVRSVAQLLVLEVDAYKERVDRKQGGSHAG